MSLTVSRVAGARAAQLCRQGVEYYQAWDIERAIETFEASILLDATQPDVFLHLAQAYVRLSDYDAMRKALGEFIHRETDQKLIDRFERLFGSALDDVEAVLTQIMSLQDVPLEVIGAAMQMWLEFKLAMGRRPINLAGIKPKAWASALDYTVRKVNFHEDSLEKLASWYKISPKAVKQHYEYLIDTLDIMPCDYRYFRGPTNPLDKLVEAAEMLETLEKRFYQV